MLSQNKYAMGSAMKNSDIDNSSLDSKYLRPKRAVATGMVIAIIAGVAIVFGLAAAAIFMFVNRSNTVNDVNSTILTAAEASKNYGGGANCTGISMANIHSQFNRSFVYSSSSKELTLPGGDMTATLDCTQAPKSSSTGPYRAEVTITAVPDNVCTKVVNGILDQVDAIQTKSDSASSTVTVKNYGDITPTGQSLVGDTACAAGSNSTLYVWLKNH